MRIISHQPPLSKNVFVSRARIGRIKDFQIGVSVPAFIRGSVDDTVVIPSQFKAFQSSGLDDTTIWWDRQTQIFTVSQEDSFPAIKFNCTKDVAIKACKFYWDSYEVNVLSSSVVALTLDKIVELAKSFPHVIYKYLLDNGDFSTNLGLLQISRRELKELIGRGL
jgi:hypothetical protein